MFLQTSLISRLTVIGVIFLCSDQAVSLGVCWVDLDYQIIITLSGMMTTYYFYIEACDEMICEVQLPSG